jgi:hypothetical protein
MGSITTAMANQCKQDLFGGTHTTSDTYKLALIKPSPTGVFDAAYATYSSTMGGDEVSPGGGYSTGGITLANPTTALTAGVGSLDFDDATWAAATISADGAVLYNSSKSNKVLAVFAFGQTYTSTNDNFKVTIPSAGTGCLRIA